MIWWRVFCFNLLPTYWSSSLNIYIPGVYVMFVKFLKFYLESTLVSLRKQVLWWPSAQELILWDSLHTWGQIIKELLKVHVLSRITAMNHVFPKRNSLYLVYIHHFSHLHIYPSLILYIHSVVCKSQCTICWRFSVVPCIEEYCSCCNKEVCMW